MFDDLQRAVKQLRRLLAGLEPDRFDGAGARTLVELFDEIERLGAAGKALATRQVVATGAWKQDGARPRRGVVVVGDDRLDARCGAGDVGDHRALSEALPTTEAAWRSGALSGTQVSAIADAAAADPGAEHELLVRAAHDGVRGLRDACARVKAAACDDESAQYERVRASRSLRCWTDPDGTGRIDIRGPVDCTARVMKTVGPVRAGAVRTGPGRRAPGAFRCARVRRAGGVRRVRRRRRGRRAGAGHGGAGRPRRARCAVRPARVRCARSSTVGRCRSRWRSGCSRTRS